MKSIFSFSEFEDHLGVLDGALSDIPWPLRAQDENICKSLLIVVAPMFKSRP